MRTPIMSARQVERTLDRLAYQIIEHNRGTGTLELIGIRKRGTALAQALADRIGTLENRSFRPSRIDIAPYRDDRSRDIPVTDTSDLPAEINDRDVILVDDVLFTGRTARAALDALVSYGRPRSIQLVVLIDRGHREYPIQPTFTGRTIPTKHRERILVDFGDQIEVFSEE